MSASAGILSLGLLADMTAAMHSENFVTFVDRMISFFGSIAGTMTLMPQWLLAGLFLVLGAILGSFIATLVIRWPQGQSVIHGRSKCDSCQTTLTAIDLVPLFSAAWLRGTCRHCSAPIGTAHWRIELLSACVGAIPFLFLPPLAAIGFAVWSWCMLPLFLLDYRHFWLPDRLMLFALLWAPFIAPLMGDTLILDRAIGAAAGFFTLQLIRLYFARLRNREAMGAGDPKLFGFLGFYFGWAALPIIMLLAATIGLFMAGLQKFKGKAITQESKFPLGSYLIGAAYVLGIAGGI